MEIISFWILLSALVGMFASNYRNRSGFGFFLLSLLLSPLFGFFFALASSKKKPKPLRANSSN